MTYEYSRFLVGDADLEAPARPVVAGKRALTDRLPVQRRAASSSSAAAATMPAAAAAPAMPAVPRVAYADPFALHLPVQLRGDADELSSEQVHAAAAQGVATPASPLPFFDQIQASFGPRHDISSIAAHLGSAATASAHAMGAAAFATGRDVVFAGAPDLHTAAHEAAHVIQQAHGVTLYGGVGAAGDSYEAHADAVADRVVAGQSAAELLDAFVGAAPAQAPGGGVQQRSLAEGLRAALAAPAAEAAAHTAPVQRALIDRLRGIVQASGTTVDYDGIVAMIHAASTAERQAVLADTQLRNDLTARLGRERASTIFSSLMEGSHTWQNPPRNDFYDYFVTRNGSGTLPNTATMNCWESILYACYLAGQISAGWIRSFYSTAMGSPDPNVSIWSQLGFSLSLPTYAPPATSGTGGATATPGTSTTAAVTPRAGQLLFYHTGGTIPGHVAVSLGGDQAISLWSQPNNVHSVQRIQVTALPGTVYVGDPPW